MIDWFRARCVDASGFDDLLTEGQTYWIRRLCCRTVSVRGFKVVFSGHRFKEVKTT